MAASMAARFDALARAIKLADAAAIYLASAAALASARYFKSAIIAFAAFESDAAFCSARSLSPLRSSDNHSASWVALTALRVARLVSALALSSALLIVISSVRSAKYAWSAAAIARSSGWGCMN